MPPHDVAADNFAMSITGESDTSSGAALINMQRNDGSNAILQPTWDGNLNLKNAARCRSCLVLAGKLA
jgi:hypothetical protein